RTAAAIGIGLNHTGVDSKAFAIDQSFPHTPLNHTLKHLPKRFALTEAAMPVLRERRMVRHRILEAQATEPAIRQIEVDLFAQSPLGANAEAITHDQHPYHQLRINRRPPGLAVKRRKVAAQFVKIEATINPTQQVIGRNVIVEIE